MSESRAYLRHFTDKTPSETAYAVAELLDRWQGIHHLPADQMRKVDWTNDRFIVINLDKHLFCGELATHDFDALTRLVFLAHDMCIRVSITSCNFRLLQLTFHPRTSRVGGMSIRHPTIEQALDSWRQRNPAPKEAAEAAT